MAALVGRAGERARLGEWLAAFQGHPRLALIEGESGIGKTALAQALADDARAAGRSVAWASGVEDAGVPPYWLWRQVVDVSTESDRFTFFEKLRSELPDERGLLVVIDDVQWVDEPSLLALRYLLRQPSSTPLWFCATRRSGDSGIGWERLGPELISGPDVTRLVLQGLDQASVSELLQDVAGRQLESSVLNRASAESGGNPLFLRELGRLIAAGGGSVGRDLAELIDARIRRLTPDAQQLLRAAAVLAEEWELAVAARLLERPAAGCLPAVDETLSAGLLTTASAGRLRFSHGLVRSVLAGQTPLQQSVALHIRAAQALEDLHGDELAPALADIARHWAEAAITGEREPAVQWAKRAADEAMRAAGYEEAVRLYTLGLESGGPTLGRDLLVRLRTARASAYVAAGVLDAAYEDCRSAAEVARSAGAVDLLADVALCLEAIGDRSWDRSIREWCQDALAGPVAESTRARLLARLAEASVYGGAFDDGVQHARDALEAAERSADDDALVAALRARQITISDPEHTEERAQLAARMTALGERLRRPEVELWGRLWAIDALWEVGDITGVASEVSRLRWCVGEVGTPIARWHLLVCRASLLQARGEFEEAMSAAREGFELMIAMGHPAAIGAFMSLATTVGHHVGQDDITTRIGPPGTVPETGELRDEIFAYVGPAYALADAGRLDEARATYGMPGPPSAWAIPPYFYRQALHVGACVAIALDLVEDIAWFRERLQGCRGSHVAGGAGSANYSGPVELTLGRCAAALGDLNQAEADLAEAVAICRQVGSPPWEVEAAVELAAVLTRLGRLGEGQSLLRKVRPVAVRLGMRPWVTRIDVALTVEPDPLSTRERQVAALVARGMSNREIATELVLSERTAANHVQHILTKLSFVNRSQIAAWVASNDLPGNE